MLGRKGYLIGTLLFVVSFLIATVWELTKEWVWIYFEPFYVCSRYNLKAVWVLSRKVSVRYQVPFPPPIEVVKKATKKSVLLTPKEAGYLGMPEFAGSYTDFPLALLCPRDPDYLLKIAMDRQGLDYEPSYLWQPDKGILALCPYCRLAVLWDGRIEKR
ncbi:MAG: hypothetical protein C4295_03000 [Candidatus Fervidibacterota bacterium]